MDVIPFLDRHLVYPILDFLQDQGAYSDEEILKAKYELLENTNMPGHCADLYKQIHNVSDAPERFETRSKEIDDELAELEKSGAPILEVLENPEVAAALRQDKSQNLAFLRDSHGITIEQINMLFRLGQFEYNRGNYAGAAEHLYHFRVLSTDHKMTTSATWGKLASEILTANWDDAQSELTKLKESIEGDGSDSLAQLKSRTWLLHWSLFPLHKSGSLKAAELQDLFFTPHYLNAVQTSAPHLLRYIVVSVLVSNAGKLTQQTQKNRIRDLTRLLPTVKGDEEAIIRFVNVVLITYDFTSAKELLAEVSKQIDSDYFLKDNADAIKHAMRSIMAESYLRVHRNSSIEQLCALLDLPQTELIQLVNEDLGHMNADIDEEDGLVEIPKGAQPTTLGDMMKKIIDRTQTPQMRQRLLRV